MNEIELDATGNEHYYKVETKRLPSVTTVLKLLANPGLEAWKRTTPGWEEISNWAADIGTRTHKAIELELKGWHQTVEEHYVFKCFDAFMQWKNQYDFELVDTEMRVVSEKGYGGTLDLICRLNGRLYIIDIKTSNQIYPDYLLQLSAYRAAYVEMTRNYLQCMSILRLDKNTGMFEFKEYGYDEYVKGRKMFMLLLEYWYLENGRDV